MSQKKALLIFFMFTIIIWCHFCEHTQINDATIWQNLEDYRCEACNLPNTTIEILFVIISAPEHFEKRQFLRSTWATYSNIFPVTRFFVGMSDNSTVNTKLQDEARFFQDTCIMTHIDSYKLLPHKVNRILFASMILNCLLLGDVSSSLVNLLRLQIPPKSR